jgi:hypothetical protein
LHLMSARSRALWGRALLLSALVTMTAHRAVHAQGNDGPPLNAGTEISEEPAARVVGNIKARLQNL